MEHVSEELLLVYIENRLGPEARARVNSHLRECEVCRAEAAEARQTHAALKIAAQALSRLPLPPLAWAGVRDRLGRPGILPAVRRSWQVAASTAVVVMALVSNLTLNAARAATPSVPAIQTPAAHSIVLDTATVEATRDLPLTDSTFTPTLTPGPGATN
ncbi:MAG: zf-HC2 domain-containing protein [Chloroflexi bacterium]|nr:zf-HC2 domain-containing protein [Chloroflexota bacterium]